MSIETHRPGALELRHLMKRYGVDDTPAVDDVDLRIEPGQFMTLLGPSGSGKTTTLNMLAGFLEPSSGSITIDGRDLISVPPHRRNFGMVFQDYALFPHMTVFNNIAYPLRQRGVAKAEAKRLVEDIAERFALGPLLLRKPDQLSGGQQQRVALSRALVFSPEVLLLDEPLGALDRKLRATLQAEMRRLHRELGLTFVFVTHDQDEAMFLSDRIAVFNKGRIERVGAPAELYDDPGTLFVASFLGEANLFAGEVVDASTYLWRGERLRHRGGVAPGSVLIVRPERMKLAHKGADVGDANAVPATVTDVARLGGGTTRIDLRFADGAVGAATSPATDIVDVRPGDEVRAVWDVDGQAFVSPDADARSAAETAPVSAPTAEPAAVGAM
ncbi:ABC transporter ATP-binding protein [Microbacterium sp. MAHUQ-60]|uniref:ABC transporter ATP-binding protein n=1 Tax=unclassified Microbacterium TaxID=2609290 RepID=UPI003617DD29